MDFKVVVAAVCVVVSGYLFYVNQTREQALLALTSKYQAAVSGTPSAVVTDAMLMESVRVAVLTELKNRPSADCTPGKVGVGDLARLQELQIKMDDLDKRFNIALKKLMNPAVSAMQDDKIALKANKIKEKIIALCKKK